MISLRSYVKCWSNDPKIETRLSQLTDKELTLFALSEMQHVQLDAFKAGIRYAAERVRRQPLYSDFSLAHRNGALSMADKLNRAADNLVQIPNDVPAEECCPDTKSFIGPAKPAKPPLSMLMLFALVSGLTLAGLAALIACLWYFLI